MLARPENPKFQFSICKKGALELEHVGVMNLKALFDSSLQVK
jgi:hypothetical protein